MSKHPLRVLLAIRTTYRIITINMYVLLSIRTN